MPWAFGAGVLAHDSPWGKESLIGICRIWRRGGPPSGPLDFWKSVSDSHPPRALEFFQNDAMHHCGNLDFLGMPWQCVVHLRVAWGWHPMYHSSINDGDLYHQNHIIYNKKLKNGPSPKLCSLNPQAFIFKGLIFRGVPGIWALWASLHPNFNEVPTMQFPFC